MPSQLEDDSKLDGYTHNKVVISERGYDFCELFYLQIPIDWNFFLFIKFLIKVDSAGVTGASTVDAS